MKKLIIYSSYHHGNTEIIAKAMAEAVNADLIQAEEADSKGFSQYGLIGFGSGIYGGKMHKNILKLMDGLPEMPGKKTFVFSTSGLGKEEFNESLVQKLKAKGFEILGSFACKGYDTFGPFKLFGGIAKGHPDQRDIMNAKNFILKFIEYADSEEVNK